MSRPARVLPVKEMALISGMRYDGGTATRTGAVQLY
jgi:hypothetical protein